MDKFEWYDLKSRLTALELKPESVTTPEEVVQVIPG